VAGVCGMVSGAGAGRVRAKFLKLLRVWGGCKFCGCGAGADTKFQIAQVSNGYISSHNYIKNI